MRILVYEFVTGGGLAGRPVPRSLAREGLAMRGALLEDLASIGDHEIVAATDVRFVRPVPHGVDLVPVVGRALSGAPGEPGRARPTFETFDSLVNWCDAVWLIAPETDRCLELLAARVERTGRMLLGSAAAAVKVAADKSRLPARLARIGIGHPETSLLPPGAHAGRAARGIGYPVVVKPARGAGCHGVRLARGARELEVAIAAANRPPSLLQLRRPGRLVMQRYIPGQPASVSLLADGRRAVPLAVNEQRICAGAAFAYRGGSTPLDHPLVSAAADVAMRTCAAIPGLRGYVGVDLVLTGAGPVVIEVNPRLTMAYLGVRAVLDGNLAALALAACGGTLPTPPVIRRRARFTAAGEVVNL